MRPTLYLLPGLLCDARVWLHQQQNLNDLADIRIPDFSQFDSLEAMADAVLADAPAQFYVAGHSMGSRVAMMIVDKAPERVVKLALLNTGLHAARENEDSKRGALIAMAEHIGMDALARTWAPPMVDEARVDDTAFMQTIFDMVADYSVDSFRKQINALLNRPDATASLQKAPKGTLLLTGQQDRWSPLSQHEEIARILSDHPAVVLIDNSGHMAPMEQPNAVTAALRNWLEER